MENYENICNVGYDVVFHSEKNQHKTGLVLVVLNGSFLSGAISYHSLLRVPVRIASRQK
jgi:hypothetical protein